MPEIVTLGALFEDELRDVYDAEHQVVRALPKLIDVVNADQLRVALLADLDETRNQIARLDRVFEVLELPAGGTRCIGIQGILEEVDELMEEGGDRAVLDAGYLAAAQRVEQYEITSYGALTAWAEILDYSAVLPLLNANQREKQAAETRLSHLAQSSVGADAAAAGGHSHPARTSAAKY